MKRSIPTRRSRARASRRLRCWLVSIAALSCLLATPACGPADGRDGVVLIVIDTLRSDRVGFGGYARSVSPNMDRLAADGVVFREARAVAAWTRPTVASILTGYTPRRHGALRYDEGLRPVPTLATRLALAGYATAAVVANPFLAKAGFERGFQTFENLSKGHGEGAGRHEPKGWHVPGELVTRAAVEAMPAGRASFLYVHYLDPHDPYQPSDEARAELVAPYDGPAEGSMAYVRGRLLAGVHEPDDAEVRHLSELYDAEVRTVDAAVGELLDWLRDSGRYDRSWVVLTADHGEEFRDHGGWLHSYTLYEEQLRVPLVIKPPRRLGVEPGVRDELVSQVDIVPTLVDGLGLARDERRDERLEGRSLLPSLRGDAGDPAAGDRLVLSEQGFGRRDGRRGLGYSGRRGPLKWIQVEGEYSHIPTPPRGECYDLSRDPAERRNLVEPDGSHPCQSIADAVEAWRDQERSEGAPLEIPPETEQRLRALGYTP
ncbi:MAG: sulfatase [Myxococcota bacterium]